VAMIGSALEMLLGLAARRTDNFKIGLPDHKAVLEAIRTQDGAAAMKRMSSLLADTRVRLLKPAKAAARKAPATTARRAPAR
jgi:DNA-binding FadR family transcriptional regulator